MATLTLTRQRTSAKNGVSAYKADNSRKSGSVYLDAKIFGGQHPETIQLVAEGVAEPVAGAPESPSSEAAVEPQAEPVAAE